jgi:hypothetical protein
LSYPNEYGCSTCPVEILRRVQVDAPDGAKQRGRAKQPAPAAAAAADAAAPPAQPALAKEKTGTVKRSSQKARTWIDVDDYPLTACTASPEQGKVLGMLRQRLTDAIVVHGSRTAICTHDEPRATGRPPQPAAAFVGTTTPRRPVFRPYLQELP